MARNKAVFDADILINLVKTNSFDYLVSHFDKIYVADYVWNTEIKNNTDEKRFLQKKMNQGLLVILEYSKMTSNQKRIYEEAYKILNQMGLADFVNQGEKITASFAKAFSVAYYMSDDNKAATYIKEYADVAIINYCDLLFIAYSIQDDDLEKILNFYIAYLSIFPQGSIPKTIRGKNGQALDFAEIMAKCSDKFAKNIQLSALLKLISGK